jgi:hypothetical protein
MGAQTEAAADRHRRYTWGAALAVAVVAFAAYANNLGNGFAMDDRYTVLGNPGIRSLANLPRFFVSSWGQAQQGFDNAINQGYWRPLSEVALALDFRLHELRPLGYHLTNNLLHAAASALTLLLLRRLGLGLFGATIGGLWFAVHTVHTEAVNLITYRTELLSCLFAIAAVHVGAHERDRRSWRRALATAGLYALGLMAKETAVTVPVILLWIDLVVRVKGRLPDRSELRDLARVQAPLFLVLLLYFAVRARLVQTTALPFFAGLPPHLVAASVMSIYETYVRLLFLPWPLLHFYDWTVLPPAQSLTEPEVLAGALLFVSAGAGALWLWWRRRAAPLAIGLGLFLIALLPFLHLVPLPVGAGERFLYLASVGPALCLGFLFERALLRFPRARLAVLCAAAVLLTPLCALTVERNRAWRSDETLLTQAAADYPGSFVVHHTLGRLYLEQGDPAAAARCFERAAPILPDLTINTVMWVRALRESGQGAAAAALLEREVKRRGPLPELVKLR